MPTSVDDVGDFFLEGRPLSDRVRRYLPGVDFADREAAYLCLKRMARRAETRSTMLEALPQLLQALSEAPNPNHVLVNIERLAQNIDDRRNLFHDFVRNPRTLEILVLLISGSQFLTEILLRHPHYFTRLTAHHRLAQPKSAEQLHDEIQSVLAPLLDQGVGLDPLPLLDALRRVQRWELLRIGTSDLLGAYDLPTVSGQLSILADSLVQAALTVSAQGDNGEADDFFVVGMGKLGGGELNYSSDIDLLFLSADDPSGYRALGRRIIDVLGRTTSEGFMYRVDMRLRPWGRSGGLVSTSDGHLTYLREHAELWEKQALLKARVIAGNTALGQSFLQQIQPLLFEDSPAEIRDSTHAIKQRIERQLHKGGRQWGQVKLGPGSIRDIEFVTQYLQLSYGGLRPEIRTPNTLDALSRLAGQNSLDADAYRVLTDGYIFLRTVENHLQLMDYQQTYKLPSQPEALNHLARRLGFGGPQAGVNFMARYEQHSAVIRVVYQQHLGSGREPGAPSPQDASSQTVAPNLLLHLTRMPAAYITTFSEPDIEHHASLTEQLNPENPVIVEASRLGDQRWRLTIVSYDYIGQLSLICGLLLTYGFNIVDGEVFSYAPVAASPKSVKSKGPLPRRRRSGNKRVDPTPDTQGKIVDVFTIRSLADPLDQSVWADYARDLTFFVNRLRAEGQREAHGDLIKRVCVALQQNPPSTVTLYPIDIEIDNDASQQHTVLRIDAPDTIGFLYEFTNALALNGINIRRVTVDSAQDRVRDILYVTDAHDQKITAPEKQRELRIATVLIKHFTHLLPQSPNPELALLHFRDFVDQLFTLPDWPEELTSLEQPEVLNTLARLLGVSDFLWDDFLRMQHANLFPILQNVEALAEEKAGVTLRQELESVLENTPIGPAQVEAINAFKDREMFRIDMRQIQGHITEFGQFSKELTDLAELTVEAAYRMAVRDLQEQFGSPRLTDNRPCPMAICALGKCGGRELGFASDIELMFVYAGDGETTGPRVVSAAEYFNRLVGSVKGAIRARKEGIFELDLRLRPYGKAGSLSVSLDSFKRYFVLGGEAWPYERQALVKVRPIAGDAKFGRKVVRARDDLIYNGQAYDVPAMRAMRERQLRHLVTAGSVNAKFSAGGLVDIEYLVQGMQITHGHLHGSLRATNTHEAMQALSEKGFLSQADFVPLHEALVFQRRLIDALRMVRGHAKDLTIPPTESEEFAFLARRLNYSSERITELRQDLTRHMTTVQEINTRLLGQVFLAVPNKICKPMAAGRPGSAGAAEAAAHFLINHNWPSTEK